MKIQIVNVSVAQSAKVLAVLYVLISLPIMLFVAAAGALGGQGGAALLMLVLGPAAYGLVTFLCTGLVAWLYNVVARRIGGLEYRVQEMSGAAAEA